MYLYGNSFNTANADYFETFQNLTGWNILQITNAVHSPASYVTEFFNTQIVPPIYAHYAQPFTWKNGNSYTICNSTIL